MMIKRSRWVVLYHRRGDNARCSIFRNLRKRRRSAGGAHGGTATIVTELRMGCVYVFIFFFSSLTTDSDSIKKKSKERKDRRKKFEKKKGTDVRCDVILG